jgi:DNA-binding response OmpR family regulator
MARILVVDANDAIRCLLSNLLRSRGYEVGEAADGQQALARFITRSYDMVLIEIHLPRLNGYEVCKRLRQVSRVPILMMSANDHPDIRAHVRACAATTFVPKPVEFGKVLSWVDAVSLPSQRKIRFPLAAS